MALYSFQCPSCKFVCEKRLTFAEHDELKNKLQCEKCCDILVQQVAPLRFKLKGYGWYASEVTQGIDPYAISQSEINKNLDEEKRKEEWCVNMQERDLKEGI